MKKLIVILLILFSINGLAQISGTKEVNNINVKGVINTSSEILNAVPDYVLTEDTTLGKTTKSGVTDVESLPIISLVDTISRYKLDSIDVIYKMKLGDSVAIALASNNDTIVTNNSMAAYVAANGGGVSFGIENQVPFINVGGTDFEYSPSITWNGIDFCVVGGIKYAEKTYYYAVNNNQFISKNPDVDDVTYGTSTTTTTVTVDFYAAVNLPNGAIIKSIIVTGSVSTRAWQMARKTNGSTTTATIGNNVLNTIDATLLNNTVDNSGYSYFLIVSGLASGERIYDATITYTMDTL